MKIRIRSWVTFLYLFLFTAGSYAAEKPVQLWLTKIDKSALFTLQPNPQSFGTNASAGAVIDVDDRQRFQTMDGFGFALTGGSAMHLIRMQPAIRAGLLHELFATDSTNIGISYLRLSIGASDLNDRVFTYDDMPKGQTDPGLARFSLDPDRADVIPVLKEILSVNPTIKILGSPWTAPPWMKTNNLVKGGKLNPQFYDVYAHYFVKYIQGMKAEGIRIDAITVQNEPLNTGNTPSMQMFAPEQALFIKKFLGPALAAARLDAKIILYDHNCDVPDYPMFILRDPDAARFVDGSGFHHYAGKMDAMSKVHDAFPQKNLYFTEQMVIDEKRKGFDIAAQVARLIVGAPRNWSRNVLLWNLAADSHNKPHTDDGGCPMCQGAITIEGNEVQRNIAYYVVAHAAKFVRPGSVRIASNQPENLANVAFQTSAGGTVLIVANRSRDQQLFQIRYQGRSVSAALDGGAVGTFVW